MYIYLPYAVCIYIYVGILQLISCMYVYIIYQCQGEPIVRGQMHTLARVSSLFVCTCVRALVRTRARARVRVIF